MGKVEKEEKKEAGERATMREAKLIYIIKR